MEMQACRNVERINKMKISVNLKTISIFVFINKIDIFIQILNSKWKKLRVFTCIRIEYIENYSKRIFQAIFITRFITRRGMLRHSKICCEAIWFVLKHVSLNVLNFDTNKQYKICFMRRRTVISLLSARWYIFLSL